MAILAEPGVGVYLSAGRPVSSELGVDCCCGDVEPCWYEAPACECSDAAGEFRYVPCANAEAHPDWPGPIIFPGGDDICFELDSGTPTVAVLPPGAVVLNIPPQTFPECDECCGPPDGCWYPSFACQCSEVEPEEVYYFPCDAAPPPGVIWYYLAPNGACHTAVAIPGTELTQLPPGADEVFPSPQFTNCQICCGCPPPCEDCEECTDQLFLTVGNWNTAPAQASPLCAFAQDGCCTHPSSFTLNMQASSPTSCSYLSQPDIANCPFPDAGDQLRHIGICSDGDCCILVIEVPTMTCSITENGWVVTVGLFMMQNGGLPGMPWACGISGVQTTAFFLIPFNIETCTCFQPGTYSAFAWTGSEGVDPFTSFGAIPTVTV